MKNDKPVAQIALKNDLFTRLKYRWNRFKNRNHSNLVEHAKRELKVNGYDLNSKDKNEPNNWVRDNILELMTVFSKQGHSGSSAPYVLEMFKKLASFEPVGPIIGNDSEWNEYYRKNKFTL